MSKCGRLSCRRGLVVPLLVLICAYGLWSRRSAASGPPGRKSSIKVVFSPDGGCTDRVVREIGRARRRIRVQMYYFTSRPIADALIEAKKRGVACEVIVDKSQESMAYGRLPVLRREGVSVLIDAEHATANNKIMLIDGKTILTGSFNYTKAAEEKNAENLLVIKRFGDLIAKYEANYDAHRAHSRKF